MEYTRRELGELALAGLASAGLLLKPRAALAGTLVAKPNSKWAGVQVGINAPYSFGNNSMSSADTLERLLQLGLSAVELRSQPIELFMGAPLPPAGGGRRGAAPPGTNEPATAGDAPARGRGQAPAPLTPAQQAERQTAADALQKWRVSASMSKARELRKVWDDAGVRIEIVKFDWLIPQGGTAGQPEPPLPTTEVIEHIFELTKTVGARGISTELPLRRMDATKLIGKFADKHKIWVGYHNHLEVTPANFEEAFSYAKYNGANFDIGHFVAGQNTSPIPFLKQHHDRVTHMHTKDRKLGTNGGANVAFGLGDTPVKEALRLIRDNKWDNIQATLEFEYPVPQGSDRMTEIAKTAQYCKECLLG